MPALTIRPGTTLESLNAHGVGHLPGWFGVEAVGLAPGRLSARMLIRPEMLAPDGSLHAAAIIALADTAAGYATRAHLPEGAASFATIELKTNFFGTQAEGVLLCEATAVHGGRHTQVWDAEVSSGGSGSRLALFRCTQLIQWPKGLQN